MSIFSRRLYFQVHGVKPPRSPRKASKRGPARNYRYKIWIRTLPSCASGYAPPCEAAHTGSDGGMRQKAGDYSCVPLTVEEHILYHTIGKQDFEKRYGIYFADIVRALNLVWFRYSRRVK